MPLEKRLNLTQKELATLAGMSQKKISFLELGVGNNILKINTLLQLANVMGLQPYEFLDDWNNNKSLQKYDCLTPSYQKVVQIAIDKLRNASNFLKKETLEFGFDHLEKTITLIVVPCIVDERYKKYAENYMEFVDFPELIDGAFNAMNVYVVVTGGLLATRHF